MKCVSLSPRRHWQPQAAIGGPCRCIFRLLCPCVVGNSSLFEPRERACRRSELRRALPPAGAPSGHTCALVPCELCQSEWGWNTCTRNVSGLVLSSSPSQHDPKNIVSVAKGRWLERMALMRGGSHKWVMFLFSSLCHEACACRLAEDQRQTQRPTCGSFVLHLPH